jgi:hypothetical protein
MKDKFIKYCAKIIGGKLETNFFSKSGVSYYKKGYGQVYYDPYDDLNQMAEVVEMIVSKRQSTDGLPTYNNMFIIGVKQTFMDFIISTMPEEES